MILQHYLLQLLSQNHGLQNSNLQYKFKQMNQNIKTHAIQLIGIKTQNKQLYLTEEGKYFLEQINDPISVISIAGLYRTGKSFLVNQLVSKLLPTYNQSQKFIVGNSVQSCTKGLNVCSIPFKSNNLTKNFVYIVIDSQGIGSLEQQVNYDLNLLMLIFLISSTVLYNSIGAIDQQSLDQLRVIVNLKNCLGKNQEKSQPRFIWVLRDFALQLINKKGDSMTSDQYLEDCLETVNSSNKQIIKKNEIRNAIKQNLVNRQCHTLVRPTIKEEQLGNLSKLPKNKLRQEFIQQTNDLFNSVFRNDPNDIKYLNDANNLVNGPTLVKMIEYFLSQINNSKVPEVISVWQLIQSTKFEQIMEQCQNQLKTQALTIDFPQSDQDLKIKLNQIQNTIYLKFQHQFSTDLKTFKRFNKHFTKLSSKINAKISKANNDIRKKKALKIIRDTINRQIQFDKVDPCELSTIKEVIQKLNFNPNTDRQIYEYVLSTILDVLYISQQKSIKMRNQLNFLEQSRQFKSLDNKQKQQELASYKQKYQQALKQISILKTAHMQSQRDLAILKQQNITLESNQSRLSKQKLQKQEELRLRNQQLSQKLKKKNEENMQAMKSLRTENQHLFAELQETKKLLTQKCQQQRKQVIFQQKIKQSYDRFQQQRAFLKKQLQKFKSQFILTQQKLKISQQKLQDTRNLLRTQKQGFNMKQKDFCEQLRWMRQNYSKTKAAYNQSANTRIQNQKILQEVTLSCKRRNLTNENIENHMANNFKSKLQDKIMIQDLNANYQKVNTQKQSLKKELMTVKLMLQKQALQKNKTIQFFKDKSLRLQEQAQQKQKNIDEQKQRFYKCLKQIEEAKQSQRKMYQDSIMRLLNNIQNCDGQILKKQRRKTQGGRQDFASSQLNFSKNRNY